MFQVLSGTVHTHMEVKLRDLASDVVELGRILLCKVGGEGLLGLFGTGLALAHFGVGLGYNTTQRGRIYDTNEGVKDIVVYEGSEEQSKPKN